jgi:hypothetical protein
LPLKKKRASREVNVPWITNDGYVDLTKIPIDSTLCQALSDDREEFANACRVLSAVSHAGRAEAGIFLCGLLGYYQHDRTKKERIVEALGRIKTEQVAGLLFAELENTESCNATRGYINRILEALEEFPDTIIRSGFERLLSDPRWTYRMKRKFREILGS